MDAELEALPVFLDSHASSSGSPVEPEPEPLARSSSPSSVGGSGSGVSQQNSSHPVSLVKFLQSLPSFEPLIPEEVTELILQKVGCDVGDPQLFKMVSLAAQNFLSEVLQDALEKSREQCRLEAEQLTLQQQLQSSSEDNKKRKVAAIVEQPIDELKASTLTLATVSAALSEHGVNVDKPAYFVGSADEHEL